MYLKSLQSKADLFLDGAAPRERRHALWHKVINELRQMAVLVTALIVFFTLYQTFGKTQHHPLSPTRSPTFPRKVWQSWKVDPTNFEDRDAERVRSWIALNPDLRYEVLTDGNGEAYVEEVFGRSGFNRPDIVHVYKSLNARIIQADLLRYIIMYAEGGIWADIDVEALQPFRNFIPAKYHETDVDMIIGIETDEPGFKDHPTLGSKAQSFVQWTFACKPQLPVMLSLIEHILVWLQGISEKEGKPIGSIELDFDEVLTGTGPSAFTDAVLAQMARSERRNVTWNEFHNLDESKVVGRVLVLPSEAFAAGTGHSKSGNHGGKGAMVKHHFHASSWTKSHPRLKHPIYGEVEKCNWDKECVRLWDENTAYFNTLPIKDQHKLIALQALEDDPNLKSQFLEQPPADAPLALPEAPADAGIGLIPDLTPGLAIAGPREDESEMPLATEGDSSAESSPDAAVHDGSYGGGAAGAAQHVSSEGDTDAARHVESGGEEADSASTEPDNAPKEVL
jgi:mannosyltransferase OCH1-like enzyme